MRRLAVAAVVRKKAAGVFWGCAVARIGGVGRVGIGVGYGEDEAEGVFAVEVEAVQPLFADEAEGLV